MCLNGWDTKNGKSRDTGNIVHKTQIVLKKQIRNRK